MYLAAVHREFADHLTAREAQVLAGALRKVLAAGDDVPEIRSRISSVCAQASEPGSTTVKWSPVDLDQLGGRACRRRQRRTTATG